MKQSSFQSLLICLCLSVASCAQVSKKDTSKPQHSNALIHESSPYLLQHAHNPVNWYPWGKEALDKAQKENKMLIISIGYAACHWCHVMEHESFEDSAVAKLMNEHFVCIKVDREERPDVDQVYMTACQLITKSGGWPLNAFALADGKPFHAGTYFPKADWTKVLNYFIDLKQKDPKSLETAAQQVTDGISQMGRVGLSPISSEYSMDKLDNAFNNWSPSIDFELGGFDKAPKFPLPSSWDFLLQYAFASHNKKALEAVQVTLDNMARGGIYDQLGGGFARYSTDAIWKAPHFEKMLYDNGQLVSLYAQAYLQTKEPLYKKIVYETLDWIEREMTHSEGGFYSSLDADSEGEEGKFYVWKTAEIKSVLGEDAKLFLDYYNCTDGGNWEHQNNILLRQKNEEKILQKFQLSPSELEQKITTCKNKLMLVRNKRVRPALDDKILTSWNALMLTGYLKAYRAFGEEKFLKIALKNANFLKSKTIGKDFKITRNYKDGKSVISGFLDDYAFLISAYIELYQVTFDEQWLLLSKELANHCIEHFLDKTSGMFNYTPNYNASLVSRQMEVTDNVIPASNSEMANNLYKLSLFFYNKDYLSISKQQLDNVYQNIETNPAYFSNWAKLFLNFVNEPYSVAIVGKDAAQKRQELDQYYLPNTLLMGGKTEGSLELLKGKNIPNQTTIFVCQNKACKRPVTAISEALELIK